MKMNSVYLMTIILLLVGNPLIAFSNNGIDKDTVLVFDQPGFITNQLEFRSNNRIQPKQNDFLLLDMAFMSNKIGERWAIVTIKNLASGRRSLKEDYLVATFADGSQSIARNTNATFRGRETLTISLFMGIHKFPIVRIQSE